MNRELSGSELVGALNALGVHFLSGYTERNRQLSSDELIAGLAMQSDARMRLALIPLFLFRPDFAYAIPKVVQHLPSLAVLNLKLFYTASVILQQLYRRQLAMNLGVQQELSDFFGHELDISDAESSETRLQQLGEQHKILVGIDANWVGTYHHGARRLFKRLAAEAAWNLA